MIGLDMPTLVRRLYQRLWWSGGVPAIDDDRTDKLLVTEHRCNTKLHTDLLSKAEEVVGLHMLHRNITIMELRLFYRLVAEGIQFVSFPEMLFEGTFSATLMHFLRSRAACAYGSSVNRTWRIEDHERTHSHWHFIRSSPQVSSYNFAARVVDFVQLMVNAAFCENSTASIAADLFADYPYADQPAFVETAGRHVTLDDGRKIRPFFIGMAFHAIVDSYLQDRVARSKTTGTITAVHTRYDMDSTVATKREIPVHLEGRVRASTVDFMKFVFKMIGTPPTRLNTGVVTYNLTEGYSKLREIFLAQRDQ
jgi:hypothetical protein